MLVTCLVFCFCDIFGDYGDDDDDDQQGCINDHQIQSHPLDQSLEKKVIKKSKLKIWANYLCVSKTPLQQPSSFKKGLQTVRLATATSSFRKCLGAVVHHLINAQRLKQFASQRKHIRSTTQMLIGALGSYLLLGL